MRRSYRSAALFVLLAAHGGMLAWSASRHSPTLNEPGFLAAGLSHWQHRRFDLYRVNPPLVRLVAAIPLVATGATTDWHRFYDGPGARPEFHIGADFVAANGEETFRLTTYARWACIPFSLLGAWICYAWASELYGAGAGLSAAALWCFCPTILAHGSLSTTDVPCAALAAAASYCFWHWIRTPSWNGAALTGLVLGLAELTKMTLLVLYVVNTGYLFEDSLTPLGEFDFVSDLLTGNSDSLTESSEIRPGNRFADTWLGRLRVPLPKNYVLGADLQRADFEHLQIPSYLRGHFEASGWWYYYVYALAVKVPLGTSGLLLVTTILRLTGTLRGASCGAEFFLLAPAAATLAFVSSQSGFSEHSRYVIPIFPFVFIWISQVARTVSCGMIKTGAVCAGLLAWSIISSLAYYPHSLSYFNELAGGPQGGHVHLLGSEIDWGQDLLYLKQWLEQRPDARPLYFSCVGYHDARDLGIDGVDAREQCGTGAANSESLLPGWYAVSVNDLCRWRCLAIGAYNAPHDGAPCALRDLANRVPFARIGYTIYLFHVRLMQAEHHG